MLKLLQWGEPTRPWRLKTPAHMLSLDYLDARFPDARFVMTHRDPTDVMLSVADVYADIVGGFTDDLDRRYLGRAQRRAVVGRHATGRSSSATGGADDRFYDIDFRAMQADPIGEVRGLYAWLGEPVTDEFEAGMQRVVGARTPRTASRSTHADPADFGLDLDAIRPLFADYVDTLAALDRATERQRDTRHGNRPDRRHRPATANYMFAERPDDPEMRDSVSFWVFDDRGEVGLPRIGIEAVAVELGRPRASRSTSRSPTAACTGCATTAQSWPAEGPDGRPTVLGAGPLAFTLRASRSTRGR